MLVKSPGKRDIPKSTSDIKDLPERVIDNRIAGSPRAAEIMLTEEACDVLLSTR